MVYTAQKATIFWFNSLCRCSLGRQVETPAVMIQTSFLKKAFWNHFCAVIVEIRELTFFVCTVREAMRLAEYDAPRIRKPNHVLANMTRTDNAF